MFGRKRPLGWVAKVFGWFWPQRGFRRAGRYLLLRLRRFPGTRHSIALGFAWGAGVSFTPFVGFHFALAALFSWLSRGSVIAGLLGTVVGNPWTFPFIWGSTLGLGRFLLSGDPTFSENVSLPAFDWELFWSSPKAAVHFVRWHLRGIFPPMLLGGVILGGIAGVGFYVLLRELLSRSFRSRKKKKKESS